MLYSISMAISQFSIPSFLHACLSICLLVCLVFFVSLLSCPWLLQLSSWSVPDGLLYPQPLNLSFFILWFMRTGLTHAEAPNPFRHFLSNLSSCLSSVAENGERKSIHSTEQGWHSQTKRLRSLLHSTLWEFSSRAWTRWAGTWPTGSELIFWQWSAVMLCRSPSLVNWEEDGQNKAKGKKTQAAAKSSQIKAKEAKVSPFSQGTLPMKAPTNRRSAHCLT